MYISIMLVINSENLVLHENHFFFHLEKRRVGSVGDNYLGQASIPVLNRTGYSMYWLSSWDDKHIYNGYFNEDMFVRSFIDNLFHRKISTHFIYFSKKTADYKYKKFLERYKIFFKHSVNFKQTPKFLRRFYKIPYYWSKIRIIRFERWLVIYMHIFSTNKRVYTRKYPRNTDKTFFMLGKAAFQKSFFDKSFFNFD